MAKQDHMAKWYMFESVWRFFAITILYRLQQYYVDRVQTETELERLQRLPVLRENYANNNYY